jgi:hypothetical protein
LNETGAPSIWDKEILLTKNYKEFTKFHLKELVRLRFLPSDWPENFADSLLALSGKDLLLKNTIETTLLKKVLEENNVTLESFENWTGFDMINDFYKLRSADELAFEDIGTGRLKQYELVCHALKTSDNDMFKLWANIFEKSKNGQPANHFKINLEQNSIERILN